MAGFDVERDRRFVEDEQVGVRHERDGESHALGLAARQLVRPPVRDVGDPGEGEHVVDDERVRVQRRDHRHEPRTVRSRISSPVWSIAATAPR